MIAYHLALEYRLATGWRTPFFTALAEGRALGWRCGACGRVGLPPLAVCSCGARTGGWVELPGGGRVVAATAGTAGCAALVRFDGADTLTLARLTDESRAGQRCHLVTPEAGPPIMIVRPGTEETG